MRRQWQKVIAHDYLFHERTFSALFPYFRAQALPLVTQGNGTETALHEHGGGNTV